MVRETRLSPENLVLPLFVVEGTSVREPIVSMPGVHRFSVDQVVLEAKRVADLGISSVILFGIPAVFKCDFIIVDLKVCLTTTNWIIQTAFL